jgi:hypothetical protein
VAEPATVEPAAAETGVRAALAEMFDIPAVKLRGERAAVAAPVERPAERPRPAPVRSFLPPADSEEDMPPSAPQPAAEPVAAASEPARPASPPAAAAPQEEEEAESIAAYMERLLSRNRREPQPAAAETSSPAAAPTAPKSAAASEPAGVASAGQPLAEPSAEAPTATEEAAAEAPVEPKPRPKPPAAELRAGLDSLREVANRSARSAIATYHWKRLRSQILTKSILTATSLLLSIALFLGKSWGKAAFPWLGGTCVVLGLITGVDLVRACLWIRKQSRGGPKPPRAGSEKTAPTPAEREEVVSEQSPAVSKTNADSGVE